MLFSNFLCTSYRKWTPFHKQNPRVSPLITLEKQVTRKSDKITHMHMLPCFIYTLQLHILFFVTPLSYLVHVILKPIIIMLLLSWIIMITTLNNADLLNNKTLSANLSIGRDVHYYSLFFLNTRQLYQRQAHQKAQSLFDLLLQFYFWWQTLSFVASCKINIFVICVRSFERVSRQFRLCA